MANRFCFLFVCPESAHNTFSSSISQLQMHFSQPPLSESKSKTNIKNIFFVQAIDAWSG